jgi:hypothetical protein
MNVSRHTPSLTVVLVVLACAWGNDYQSCLRSAHVRASLRITYAANAQCAAARATVEHGLARALDLQAERASLASLERASPLVCLAPLPPT